MIGKRILLLEDENEMLELIQLILEDEGYNVFAFNRYEPVEEIMEFAPKLIILDIRLLNGYGHLLCSELKANFRTSRIPVILISSANNLEMIARECSADDFLAKPFIPDDLINKVKQFD
jgi:DNA-binding response OmpR family regulator